MTDVTKKAKNIKLVATDIDGVWTDASMYVSPEGEWLKAFSTYDGMATAMLKDKGIIVAILTGENSDIVIARAEKLKIDEVYIGIAGQHIKSLQHRGEMVRDDIENEITIDDMEKLRENMFKLVTVPGEEVIHVIPQEYTVDGEDGIQNPKGMTGIKLEANFHIITAQVAAVRNIIRCVKKAGLNAKELILEPFASAIATLDSDELNEGVALVDIGGGTTDVAIFLDGIIRHTAVIPFGGNIITKDIKVGLSILEKQAELLKIKFGSAMHTSEQDNVMVSIPGLRGRDPKEISIKNLAEIIGARMKEIIDLVYHEIKVSGFENKLMTGIVLTGGGSQLRALPQLVSYITGKDVRVGLPNEHLGKDSHGKVTSPMYSTGVGLVLKGFEDLEVQLVGSDEASNKQKPKVGGILVRLKELLAEFFEEDVT